MALKILIEVESAAITSPSLAPISFAILLPTLCPEIAHSSSAHDLIKPCPHSFSITSIIFLFVSSGAIPREFPSKYKVS